MKMISNNVKTHQNLIFEKLYEKITDKGGFTEKNNKYIIKYKSDFNIDNTIINSKIPFTLFTNEIEEFYLDLINNVFNTCSIENSYNSIELYLKIDETEYFKKVSIFDIESYYDFIIEEILKSSYFKKYYNKISKKILPFNKKSLDKFYLSSEQAVRLLRSGCAENDNELNEYLQNIWKQNLK